MSQKEQSGCTVPITPLVLEHIASLAESLTRSPELGKILRWMLAHAGNVKGTKALQLK